MALWKLRCVGVGWHQLVNDLHQRREQLDFGERIEVRFVQRGVEVFNPLSDLAPARIEEFAKQDFLTLALARGHGLIRP